MMENAPERVQVDRVEGGRAVLVCGPEGRETISLPARMLPLDAGEGTALDLTLRIAPGDATGAEVQGLLEDLFAASAPDEQSSS
ncbi:MAG: DUF3006 domain-containing protein [Armatimonadetes bacterium]|nr:DUF3006 domain-containing protein [Armatimonadota bacterium]